MPTPAPRFGPEQFHPVLKLDAETALSELTIDQVGELARMSPTGEGNPVAQLVVPGLSHRWPPQHMGKENQHVKMHLTDGRDTVEAVGWNCPEAAVPKNRFDIACVAAVNSFNGARSVQLKVLDWQPAGGAIPGPPPR